MPDPILDLAGVSKSFGALTALSDVSSPLGPRELLGLAGPNASGKSTLFNVLTHLLYGPDRGEIRLAGRALAGLRPDQIARNGLVRIFQTKTDFSALSVLENLLIALPAQPSRAAGRAKAEALLDRFGLLPEANRLADEIGVFQRKKLKIATALACAPKVLLLDEPAAGLSKPGDRRDDRHHPRRPCRGHRRHRHRTYPAASFGGVAAAHRAEFRPHHRRWPPGVGGARPRGDAGQSGRSARPWLTPRCRPRKPSP